MKLKDYIADGKLAAATEIYNANFTSVEDVAALMEKIKEEEKEFNKIIYEFNTTLYNIKVGLSKIANKNKRLARFNEFKSSHIASLIKTFIENNTEDNMNAIKKEIERSNDFEVYIIDKWKPGDGERAYGLPQCECICVDYTKTFYRFDRFDIDDDIQHVEHSIKELESYLDEYIDKKNEMYDTYGVDALINLFTQFEEKHGPIKADDEWAHWRFEDYYEDDFEDY